LKDDSISPKYLDQLDADAMLVSNRTNKIIEKIFRVFLMPYLVIFGFLWIVVI